MKCVGHPSNTRSLDPPAGWDHEKLQVYSVGVTDVVLNGDTRAIATFWKPDAYEMDALLLGGTVMLSVIGDGMPPVAVQVAKAAEPVPPGGDARCTACGCTDSQACPGGCSWAWVDRETERGLCSSCVVADLAERVQRAGELTPARPEIIPSLRACCHEPVPAFDPARAINGELRTEMLDMLRCMARGDLADRVKDEPLKKIVGAIFTELSEADSDAQETPTLRERIAELQGELAAAAEAPRQVAALNDRLIAANALIDSLQQQVARGRAA